MMSIVAIILILMFGLLVSSIAATSLVTGLRGIRDWRTAILLPAGVLGLYGVGGFLGPALSSMGGLDWVGSFEWPIGVASGVARLPDGRYVVPHTSSGRVQVYDRARRFERGWRINSAGGTFILRTSPDAKIQIDTARGNRHFVYAPDGRLLLDVTYPSEESDARLAEPPNAITMMIPTPWWQWPLTGPFYGWLCFGGMMALWALHDRLAKKRPRKPKAKFRAAAGAGAGAAAGMSGRNASTARPR